MIEYFEHQLRQASSITQLVQFIKLHDNASWNPTQGFQPSCGFQVLMTVHPEYHELKGLKFLGWHGAVPVFADGKQLT